MNYTAALEISDSKIVLWVRNFRRTFPWVWKWEALKVGIDKDAFGLDEKLVSLDFVDVDSCPHRLDYLRPGNMKRYMLEYDKVRKVHMLKAGKVAKEDDRKTDKVSLHVGEDEIEVFFDMQTSFDFQVVIYKGKLAIVKATSSGRSKRLPPEGRWKKQLQSIHTWRDVLKRRNQSPEEEHQK